MSAARRWLLDNQRPLVWVASSICFVTAAGSIGTFAAGQRWLSDLLLAACSVQQAVFATGRAVLIRSLRLGALAMALGVLAAALPFTVGSYRSAAGWIVLAALAAVTSAVLRRPVAEVAVEDAPGDAEAGSEQVSPEPAAAPRPQVGQAGFEYAPPPKR